MDVIKLTKQLINIDSSNPGKYEFAISKFIEDYLKNINKNKIKIYKSHVIDGRKNIMAVFHNNKNKNHNEVVFICHMDTVVSGSGWDTNPFHCVESDGKLYGRGSSDMKSGVAISLSVFKYFVDNYNNSDLKKDFKVIFTVDEEANMLGVEKVIKDKWVNKNSFVCDLEPTDKIIQVSHKGRFWIKIKIFGKTAHASRPELGIDSNICISELIVFINNRVKKLKKDKEMGKTTVTFGLLNGGYQPYVVPDYSYMYIDFRLTPPTTSRDIINIIKDGIIYVKKKINNKLKIEYEITGDRPFVTKNDKSKFLGYIKKTLFEIYKTKLDIDYKPRISYFSGYTDTAVIASKLKNCETFSYGPGSLSVCHKPNEFVDIKDIIRCEEVYKKLIYNIIIK